MIKLYLKEPEILVGIFTYQDLWNFRYSNEYLKTDLPLIWEFPNLGDNISEYMPQLLRMRFKGNKGIKKKGLEFELSQLRKQGNNGNSLYKIEFDDSRTQ